MAELGLLEDFSGSDLLAEVAVLHRAREEAGVRILRAAAEFAFQNGPETLDPELRIDGTERLVRIGGEGTPEIAEFAPAEFASRMQRSPYAGRLLIADALDLKFRLPLLWARVQRLEVREGYARMVARKTRQLSVAHAAVVDRRVQKYADGRVPYGRFETLVEAAIRAADLDAARAREEEAARHQFAKATRETEDGMQGFYIRAGIAVIARINATVTYLAAVLRQGGHPGTDDERRVLAVLLMANPTEAVRVLAEHAHHAGGREPRPKPGSEPMPDIKKLLPTVWLFVHLVVDAGTGEVGDLARVEGHGPISAEWAMRHLGSRARFKITPVIDPLHQAPVDAYEVPERHRHAVHLLTPADVFPYATNTSRSKQIDHTVAFDHRPGAPPGQSRIGNYGPMATFHHRLKTHGGWDVKQPFPGIYLWRDRHGETWLVDCTGTRRVADTA